MMKWVAGCLLAVASSLAFANVEVVATTSTMGMLARTVGGDLVQVTVLAPPDRDPHFLQARPSMMAALRRAELLVAVGAELEMGWLPAAVQGAGNPRINPGQPGYFEAAAQVELIDVGGPADRSRGDVHLEGNPHINLDPLRMTQVALALAGRLAQIDPQHANAYRQRAESFGAQVAGRLPRWRDQVKDAPGAVIYHKDADYLLLLLGVPLLGYVEAFPGIPPSARQLKALIDRLKGRQGVVLQVTYQPERGARMVARELGWAHQALAAEPPLEADAEAWLGLIDGWVTALADAPK